MAYGWFYICIFRQGGYLILSAGSIYLKDGSQPRIVNSISPFQKVWGYSELPSFDPRPFQTWSVEQELPLCFSCLLNIHSSLSYLIISQPLAQIWQCQLKHVQQTHSSKSLNLALQHKIILKNNCKLNAVIQHSHTCYLITYTVILLLSNSLNH